MRNLFAGMMLVYSDSLIAARAIKQARAVVDEAEVVAPFHPKVIWKSREIARIYRRDRLLGNAMPYFDMVPELNEEFVALMKRARAEDVVLDTADDLFDPKNVALGQWQAQFFLRHYGTALFLARPYEPGKTPVVLVHGINGSPRDFAEMVKRFDGTPYDLLYYFYPTGMDLGTLAEELKARLKEFVARHQPREMAVVAHSMGGLVTKGALDRTDLKSELPCWTVFVSISSPWAGLDIAEKAGTLPSVPSAWEDIYTQSPYLQGVHGTPFPSGMTAYLFFGAKGGGGSMMFPGNDDNVIPLSSVVDSPLRAMFADVFGFYEDHVSILLSEHVFKRLLALLDAHLSASVR